jgi:AAA ATPase domain
MTCVKTVARARPRRRALPASGPAPRAARSLAVAGRSTAGSHHLRVEPDCVRLEEGLHRRRQLRTHTRVFLFSATGGMPSIVSKPRLVGRDEELGKVRAFLDARHELPRALLLEGEAGIGKTALWLTALEEAAALGYLVLSSRPSEAEAGFSFAGLADLFGGVASDVMAELPRPQRRSLEAALGLSEPDPGVGEGVLAFALLSALRQLAGRSPIVLAVDDVQWLDAPSLALLRYALARFESEPVAVLLTVRGDVPDWIRRAVTEQRLLSIELGPLSLGAIYELLRRQVEMALPASALPGAAHRRISPRPLADQVVAIMPPRSNSVIMTAPTIAIASE